MTERHVLGFEEIDQTQVASATPRRAELARGGPAARAFGRVRVLR